MRADVPAGVEIVCGTLPLAPQLRPVYDSTVIDFLADLSEEISDDRELNAFSDIKAFGFWCRRGNLKRLAANQSNSYRAMGRGVVFHVTPSNVALNFAFSLAFGLLAGNGNVVRLPSRNFMQSQILIDMISAQMARPKHEDVARNICLIRYARSDTISKWFSAQAQARMIWGGDATVESFKSFETMPRCVDVAFPNRYSIAVIRAEAIEGLDAKEMDALARKLFLDAYLMDQQGCSSPQALVWLGTGHESARSRFWAALQAIVQARYDHNISTASAKLLSLTETAVASSLDFITIYDDFRLVRLAVDHPSVDLRKLQNRFGVFAEFVIDDLTDLAPLIHEKFQTVSVYGFDKVDVVDLVQSHGLMGVDRVVPIGRAFDIGPIWDGFNVVSVLSRIIGD